MGTLSLSGGVWALADAAMATLAIGCTFLGMYIYYLRYVLKKVDIQKYKKDFYVPSHTLT